MHVYRMKSYYAYIRVSTARQAERGVSLPEQRDIIERYALHHGLTISHWFEDRITATIQGRPGFDRMLKDLIAKRPAGVIIHKVDRSARNLADWNEVTELLDLGFDVYIAQDSLDLKSRSGRLTGDMLAVMAADYSRNLREEVKKGIYGRMKQGLLPRPAPLGYVDNGGGRPKTIDPQTGPLIREVFDLYATGRFSLRTLVQQVNSMGIRSRSGKRLRPTQLNEILHNPFYAGVIRVKKTSESFSGIHEPLVSSAVFERVQRTLRGKAPRQATVHDFLFRRLLRCAHCGRCLIGELQKGRVYYRCQVVDCPTTTVREDTAEGHLRSLLKLLRFTDEHREQFRVAVMEFERNHHTEQQDRRQALRLQLANVNDRLNRLTDAYLDGVLEKAGLEERNQALLMERRRIDEQLAQGDDSAATAETLAEFLELACRADLLYQNALLQERRELIEIVTSNRLVDRRTPQFGLSFPFRDLSEEVEKQNGGASRNTARTRTTVRRLLKQMTSYLIDDRARATTQRVRQLLHPEAQAA